MIYPLNTLGGGHGCCRTVLCYNSPCRVLSQAGLIFQTLCVRKQYSLSIVTIHLCCCTCANKYCETLPCYYLASSLYRQLVLNSILPEIEVFCRRVLLKCIHTTRHRWPDRISLHQAEAREDGTIELSLCLYKGAAYLQPEKI